MRPGEFRALISLKALSSARGHSARMQTAISRRTGISEDQVFRRLALLTGCVFLASAAIAANLAGAHMLALGAVCGAGNAPHCAWCFGSASLVLAGLAAFAAGLARPRTLQPA